MGMYDSLQAIINCPNCNETYRHEDIQTKDFNCILATFEIGDDTRKHPAFDKPYERVVFNGIAICEKCNIYLDVRCKIFDYIVSEIISTISTGRRYIPYHEED